MSKKTDLHNRRVAVGLYRRHKAGETVRQLAQACGKPEAWVSKRLRIGERFAET